MTSMEMINASPAALIAFMQHILDENAQPGAAMQLSAILTQVENIVPRSKRAIDVYQAAALFVLTQELLRELGRPLNILEIGTAQGYSATVMALAAPTATITTLNPHASEPAIARANFERGGLANITVVEQKSVDFLKKNTDARYDLIFVDGDHKNVRLDLPFWNLLNVGGLMLFHDYSPAGSARECPPVYRALTSFKETLGREFDVLLVDDTGVGMAGWTKQASDVVPQSDAFKLAKAQVNSSHNYETLEQFYALTAAYAGEPGAIVEVGVQNGGSLAALALGAPALKVVGFDTFAGVPTPEPIDGEKAMQRYTATEGVWAAGDEKTVKALFKDVGLKAPRLVKGDVSETLLDAKGKAKFDEPIAVLHLDATLYRSTLIAMRTLYDLVLPGGLIIVSAYHHWYGIREAVDNELRDLYAFQNLSTPTLHTFEKVIWWVKPAQDGTLLD